MNFEELSHMAHEAGLDLRMEEDGLTLTDGELFLRADLTQDLKRLHPSKLRSELIVRAALGRKTKPLSGQGASSESEQKTLTAVDATAGFGEDALLLAAAGFHMQLFEVNPLIAALLEDALSRARNHPQLSEIAGRMKLTAGDSTVLLPDLEPPDVVVLDPMFPARRKSALVKKKFQLLQRLEKPCQTERELLEASIRLSPRKIIIKRPLKGPQLCGVKPSYTIEGKTIRYDCIVLTS